MTDLPVTAVKPLVYVAGPITGNPWGCVRQATDAYTKLRRLGCVPFLPQLSVIHEIVDPQPYQEWLAYDADVIRHCDALLRLPGDSAGADREVALAGELELAVFVDDPADVLGQWAKRWTADRTADRAAPPLPAHHGAVPCTPGN